MSLFTKLARDIFSPVDAAGNMRAVQNGEVQAWGSEVERMLAVFQAGGGIIFPDLDTANASLAYNANQMAWVVGDPVPSNNGVYRKTGASGSGSWARMGDLPYSMIRLDNAGAGTADAIVAVPMLPLPTTPGAVLLTVNILASNTGNVTLNGKPLRTNSGNEIAPGGLTAGSIHAFLDLGDHFRLLSDQASVAVLAAAAAFAQAALAAANAGYKYDMRSDAEASAVDASIYLLDLAGAQAVGDGGRAQYARVDAEPDHGGKLQTDDGAWWEIERRELWLDQFIGNEASDADMRAAFDRAFSRLGVHGGIVRLSPGRDYNLSGLDIPSCCVIEGPYAHIDTYADEVTHTNHGTFRHHRGLVLDPSGTITTYGSAGLVNCFVRRDGWSHADLLPVDFAGIMMTSAAYAPILKNVMGIGFDTLLKTGLHPRVFIEKLYGDALNGLDMDRSADVTRIRDVHLWPFGTIEAFVADGATDEAALIRSGTALKWRNGSAGALVDGFFALGYAVGMDLASLSTLQASRMRFERPPTENTGTIGVKMGASVDAVSIASIYVSGYEKMIQVAGTANARLDIGYLEAHLGAGTILEVQSGDITVDSWYSYLRDGILVDVQNTSSHVHINDAYHRTGGGAITDYVKVPVNGRTDRIKFNLRTEAPAGASLVTGGAYISPGMPDTGGVIDLPPQDGLYVAASSAVLTTINGGWTGREVVIRFAQARTIANTGNIAVAEAFAVSAGQAVAFIHDGTSWRPLGFYGTLSAHSVADDSVYSFTPHRTSGLMRLYVEGNTTAYGELMFRATGSPACTKAWGGTALNVATGILTGTTGSDAAMTVAAAADGKLYVENRLGAAVLVVLEPIIRP